jgi:predicted AAA+ superfamily ATPase
LAERLAASVAHLDRASESAAYHIDPDSALAREARPTLLDEWQEVPGVLAAVKRIVDQNPTAGQFILTGSVRIGVEHTWPSTGRVVRQRVYGLTLREILQVPGPTFVERLLSDPLALAELPESAWTIFDYVDAAAAGGFPDLVLRRPDQDTRARWLEGYLQELLTNDVKLAGADPDTRRFAPFVEAVALNSSRIVDQATMRDAAGISKNTAAAYEDLLESIFFSERIPAWRSDRLDRLAAMPKRYLLDTALFLHILGFTTEEVTGDPHALGALLDTFVAAQIRPELALIARPPSMLHLRDKDGRHEVDIVLELPRKRIIGIEIKATVAPDRSDARHLSWLAEKLGDRFVAGIVLHAGKQSFKLAQNIIATPISSLWNNAPPAE